MKHHIEEFLRYIDFESDECDDLTFTRDEFLQLVIRATSYIDNGQCVLCGVDTDCGSGISEYYMVHNDLWRKYGCHAGMLCIGCLEDRMGRRLCRADFTDAPINTDDDWRRSERFKDRLSA